MEKDSVQYMRDYLRYAMTFEKYVYLWHCAMDKANDELRAIYEKQKTSKQAFDEANESLETIDGRFESQRVWEEKRAAQYRRRSKKTFFIFQIFFLISFVFSVAFFVMGVKNLEASGLNIPSLVMLSCVVFFVFFLSTIVGPICLGVSVYSKQKSMDKRFVAGSKNRQKEILVEKEKKAESDYVEAVFIEGNIKKQQDAITAELKKAQRNLNDLYLENVLPEKYRSFNAVATLFEYLDTGRCDKITGHGGIYDTYENDLRLGVIIQNLVEMNARLNTIQEHQRLLYQQVQEANHALSDISYSMKEIEKTNAEIANNTAISAVANQQTTAAAQWMAWKAWANGY